MARRKKDETTEEQLNEETLEEAEVLELEASDESSEEEVEESAPKKPRRKRAPRKAAAQQVESPSEAAPAAHAPFTFVNPPSPTVAQPAAVPPVAETVGVATAPVAAPSVSVDRVLQQWEAARTSTESIVATLDKVSQLLRELPEHHAAVIQKTLKQAGPRPSAAAKAAFALSILAGLLSILSLSFSQSARQMALSAESSATVQKFEAEELARTAPAVKPSQRTRGPKSRR